MKIAKETWIIAAIGVADLVTTIVFIRHHGAQEANPLFRHYWEMGLAAFIIAKLICLLGPLLVLEWARKSSPRFVAGALRTAIVGYLGFYVVGYMQLNGPKAAAAELTPSPMAPRLAMFEMHMAERNSFRMARMVGRIGCNDEPCTTTAPSQARSGRHGMWKFAAPIFSPIGSYAFPARTQTVSARRMDD